MLLILSFRAEHQKHQIHRLPVQGLEVQAVLTAPDGGGEAINPHVLGVWYGHALAEAGRAADLPADERLDDLVDHRRIPAVRTAQLSCQRTEHLVAGGGRKRGIDRLRHDEIQQFHAGS